MSLITVYNNTNTLFTFIVFWYLIFERRCFGL
ncbi:hypothetical protein CoNPh26_CDS0104 [Staphylococcus phage S-CoN_Ph26]|nr:hypothetical protein CoNPh26_CDS0104 [Staphylococcus phage S-CoN_Ph26]